MFIEEASGILKIAPDAKHKLGTGVNDALPFIVGYHNDSELNLLPPVIKKDGAFSHASSFCQADSF